MAKHKAEETVRVRVGSVLMVGGREGRKEGGGGDDGNIPPPARPPLVFGKPPQRESCAGRLCAGGF